MSLVPPFSYFYCLLFKIGNICYISDPYLWLYLAPEDFTSRHYKSFASEMVIPKTILIIENLIFRNCFSKVHRKNLPFKKCLEQFINPLSDLTLTPVPSFLINQKMRFFVKKSNQFNTMLH